MDINELPKKYKIKRRIKPKKIFIILFLMMLLLVAGTSLALWQKQLQQTDINSIKIGCLNLKLENYSEGVNLRNAGPMSDEEGDKLTPYTFVITNTCNSSVSYTINLENVTTEEEKKLPEQYIKAKLKKSIKDDSEVDEEVDESELPDVEIENSGTTEEEKLNKNIDDANDPNHNDSSANENENSTEEGTGDSTIEGNTDTSDGSTEDNSSDDKIEIGEIVFFDTLNDSHINETKAIPNAIRAYKLYESTLKANGKVQFFLRLWMDNETPTIDEVMNATFESKITIIAENIIDQKPNSNVPVAWQDNGIFKDYYELAYEKVQAMSLEEKIGQLMIVRYLSSTIDDAITNYYVGGTTFYAVDFTEKTEAEVKAMTSSLQSKTNIPLITAVDEEGGKVIRVSSNPNLVSEPFKSSKELYDTGGLELISSDTKNKSAILKNLGLNMNFAPVVDIADPTAYIYARTLGQTPEITGQYAIAVVQASKDTGVSYSLKHFPGYGNNADTHGTSSTDETSLEELNTKHLVPFKMGIESGAEAVMIAHNIVAAVDKENPASLSKAVHNILFNDLKFTGIAITDDLDMDATKNIPNKYTKALLAGNNILLCSNYQDVQADILESIANKTLTEEQITKLAFKVIAWKYSKGLFEEKDLESIEKID